MLHDEKLLDDISLLATKFSNGTLSKANNDMSLYDFIEKKYSFGTRIVAVPKQQQTAEDLQTIRGVSIDVNAIKSKQYNKIASKVEQYQSLECESRLKRLLKHCKNFEQYYEIGFRSVDSLKLAQRHFKNVSGCDISPLSILVAQELNFNVFRHDLMCEESIPHDNKPDVLAAYHVLEHTHNPEVGIKKINSLAKSGTIIQLEIPIQPGKPQVRYGHLFAFEKNDLKTLLLESGEIKILESEANSSIESHIYQVM